LPETPCDYDVVFIGELRRLKGLGALIEATALLAAERDIRLGIAGTGGDEPEFRALVAARRLGARVEFLGHQPARAMFARGRIVVVPSVAESFPYIVLEAAAAGRPLVATNVGGIPEIFGPLAHRLVEPDDVRALAQAIALALDLPRDAEFEAVELRERARRLFSVRRMAADITSFYRELHARRTDYLTALKPAETTSL
jgi:glycosyltransferase involved in cell wall biosynthesis